MRKAMYISALGLLMACASAEGGAMDVEYMSITSHSATSSIAMYVTNSNIRGWVEEIVIDVVSATTTGDLTVAVSPPLGTDETIYDKDDLAADVTVRPRLDGNDAAGAALTNDPPWRKTVVGDDIILTLENVSATSTVFNVSIKYEKRD